METAGFLHSFLDELTAAFGTPDKTIMSVAENYADSPDDFTFYTRTLLDWACALLLSPLLRSAG